MNRWPSVTLEEVCTIISGATPKTQVSKYWGGEIPWATPKDLSTLDGPFIGVTPRMISSEGLQSCGATLLPANSVLFSSRAPIGHVAINTVPMATNQGFKSLVPKHGRLYSKYLFHWLRANRRYLEGLGNGATFKEVSKAVVARVEIPLPPMEEQRRIADILDRADALRAKRREALAHLDGLTQSIFLDMFGDLVSNQRSWRAGSVGDLVAGFTSGKSLVAENSVDRDAVFRVLKVSAVTSLRFRPEESKALPESYIPPAHHLVQSGDLLFSRANTRELIGATALVEKTPPNLALPDKLWRFVWHPDDRTTPLFICQLFRQPRFRKEIEQRASGTSGSMQNISQSNVLSIPLGVPPVASQRTFGEVFARVSELERRNLESLDAWSALFASLQHRAFIGGAR